MPWTQRANLTGPQGTKGDKGDQGAQGVIGPSGNDGSDGAAWHVSNVDPAAGTGVDGDLALNTVSNDIFQKAGGTWSKIGNVEGQAGAGLSVKGSDTAANIDGMATGALNNGDAFIVTAAGNVGGHAVDVGHMVVWDGGQWIDAGLIQGPAGPQGPPGATGAQGAAGADGHAPVLTINSTALPAGASPTITQGANPWEYELAVPQGIAGAQGPTGATGAKGDPGVQGQAGARGSKWYIGAGAPTAIGGELAGDMYLDTATGDVYELT